MSQSKNFDDDNAIRKINKAIEMLNQSKQKTEELKQLIADFMADQSNQPSAKKLIESLQSSFHQSSSSYSDKRSNEPSIEYEKLRRRIYDNTQELWNFFSSELINIKSSIKQKLPETAKHINDVLKLGLEHKLSLLSDMNRLRSIDGYEEWRTNEAKSLSNLVQKRLYYLQNPQDCKKARKLVCKLNKGCGYGCQLHHVVYCFIVAYATERTLILKSKGWRYHKQGWESVFQPLSQTCIDIERNAETPNWPGSYNDLVVVLPIIDSLVPRPSYLPLTIPADLAPRLSRLHGDPIVWWVGQFLKYLLKPQKSTQKLLETGLEKLGFQRPIVGVHVRRTDKVGTEAAYHSIEEYMKYVEEYFLQLELNGTIVQRRIFLASDDPHVITEARNKYPLYEIIGDPEIAKMAGLSTRYTDNSLNGIILDIHMLSMCDYLVCTFSSQVCRVAYEIMQTINFDLSKKFKSLDDIYYYGGQNAHNREAILAHKPINENEIHMEIGDLIGIAGNHWNGYSKGRNMRTNQEGLFPSFKVNDKIRIEDFPKYPNVK